MALSTADEILASLLTEWHKLLRGWATDGSLVAAAQEALALSGEPQTIRDLVSQWSAGDFRGIPPIVLLPSADMNGAMGAYAISTGTIYLNTDWLRTATAAQRLAVLSEELGHHLDAHLNQSDTPGDEGEVFSDLLLNPEGKSAVADTNDTGLLNINGQEFRAEYATETTAISVIGGVTLINSQLGYAIKDGTNTPFQVTFGGQNASTSNPGAGWTAMGAAVNGTGYVLYWKNAVIGQYAQWNLNGSGQQSGGALLSTAQELDAETSLGYDLNGDGMTGLTFAAGKNTFGGVNLGTTQIGYAVKNGSNPSVQITYLGDYISPAYPGSGWVGLSALADGAGFDVYIQNTSTGQYAKWDTDSKGAIVNGAYLTAAQMLDAETTLGYDLNGDGSTGFAYSASRATIDGVNLGTTQLGYAIKNGQNQLIQVTSSGQYASASFPGAGWTAMGASVDGRGYVMYWKNAVTGQYARWNLNGSGELTSGALLSTAQELEAETALNYDLNGDGQTGLIYTSGATLIGGFSLGTTELGYAVKNGSNPSVQITYNGQYISPAYPGAGWVVLSALADGTGSQVYAGNTSTGQYAKWSTDSKGAIVNGSLLTASQVFQAEINLRLDLNLDSAIGPFATRQGTKSNDIIASRPLAATFGFQGNDTLIGGTPYSSGFDVLIGGQGDDQYVVNPGYSCMVVDFNTSLTSRNSLTALGLGFFDPNTVVATIDSGKTLAVDNQVSRTSILLYDWKNLANQLQSIAFSDGTYDFQQIQA